MTELICYALIFLLLIGHCLYAGKMYREVHADEGLTLREKNDWKLKALIFPAFFYPKYKSNKSKV
ncbi:hypothetical protein [Algoriphagus namhaensis]